ncbi:hypothetical protein MWU61_08450 [Loktanella sp. F6476L]|uniref:hypothetical protein n=1 Tax=Loktanella sp. F6476L TaxID=2926405 RepID=UPI001FF3ED7F|nr:hypothetical protein [Loktanella sp. F6476L]MCK0120569.1 hypothetical protein [Loktanella sp. F6476L]
MKPLIVCLCVVPGILQAQVFGDAAGCAWLAGEPVATDSLYLYDQNTIQRAESTCPVTGALQVGSGATVVTVECSGEGDTWEDYYMIMTSADENTLLIHPEAYPEFVTEMKVCVPQ